MNETRYQELLGRLFEGALSGVEEEELARELSASPGHLDDLHRHLVLWEVWSQHEAPERSAEAFVAGWKTRLRAEGEGAGEFSQKVQRQIEPDGVRSMAWLARLWNAIHRPAGIAWAASAVVAVFAVVFFVVLPRSAQAKVVTLHGEAVCPACVLHESKQHTPAVRVHKDGASVVYHLIPSPALTIKQGYFCSGPKPITVEGKPRTEGGRLLLDVSHAERPPQPPKPSDDQRVLFPL